MKRFETAEQTQAQADREASSRAVQIVSQSNDLWLVLLIVVAVGGFVLWLLGVL